jgi:hypothetical protein
LSGSRLLAFSGIFGDKERKTIVRREAIIIRGHWAKPSSYSLIVLVDNYPAIEVQKAAITGAI